MRDYPVLPFDLHISPHFTVGEVFRSGTAIRLSILNLPETRTEYDRVITAATTLAINCLEPLRKVIVAPIIIHSWYRCPELNRVVGGDLRSQHLTGEAADIDGQGVQEDDLFNVVRHSNIPYDKVILETRTGRGEKTAWVHLSHSSGGIQRLMAMESLRAGEYVMV